MCVSYCVCVFAFVLSSIKVSVCSFLCLFAFVSGNLCVRVSVLLFSCV